METNPSICRNSRSSRFLITWKYLFFWIVSTLVQAKHDGIINKVGIEISHSSSRLLQDATPARTYACLFRRKSHHVEGGIGKWNRKRISYCL